MVDAPPSSRPDAVAELVRGGPWLIVWAAPDSAESMAHRLAGQCEAYGIGVHVRSVSEARIGSLQCYRCVVVVLPFTAPADIGKILSDVVAFVTRYQVDNGEGLRALLKRRRRWFEVNVVQVVGPKALVEHRRMRDMRPCAVHVASSATASVNLVEPFAGRIADPTAPMPLTGAEVLTGAARVLSSWGVSGPGQVGPLRARFERQRTLYENPRKPSLFRPVKGIASNRLDFILDGIECDAGQARKSWMENGARVCRETITALQEVDAAVRRPVDRENRKDAQQDLRTFYLHLRAVDNYLQHTPAEQWPTW